MMAPKRMRKKTRKEISTGLKRAAHSRCKKLTFAPLEVTTYGAAIGTSCVGTVCILIYAVNGKDVLRHSHDPRVSDYMREEKGFVPGDHIRRKPSSSYPVTAAPLATTEASICIITIR